MTRLLLLARLLLSLFAVFLSASITRASERPNIVLIMADDIGVEGIGCYGGLSYRTPSLDQLAKQGVRFEHAYAQPLCTNTRVQLMTGLYNNRNWRCFGVLNPQAKTIGHYMQEAGYTTCMAGKWQLQSYDPPSYPGSHLRRGTGMKVTEAGFDEYSLYHSWHTEDKGSRYPDPTLYENGKLLKEIPGQYGPDHWVDFIGDFIDRKKDGKKPFFVYYAMALPHRPFVPTPDSPDWPGKGMGDADDTSYFPGMVEYMDKCVGRVVDHIDQAGLGDNTLVIFYSDNGTHQKITSQTQSGPVVGGKGKTTDAGTHVPLMVRWTGKVSPGLNDNLVDSTDFLPTVMEAANQPIADDLGLDGISFYPQLFGDTDRVRPWVFCHYDPRPGYDKDQFRKKRFARDRRFKLYGDGKLYDIDNDKLEKQPILATADTKTSREARERLASVLSEMPNPDPEPRDGDPRDSEQRLYVASRGQLLAFELDQDSGDLEVLQTLGLQGAGPFTFSPNRKLMYAAAGGNKKDSAAIATIDVNADGTLELANKASVNLRPGYLMTDNNGEFLAGNHYGEGTASIWKIDPVYGGETLAEMKLEPKAHSTVFSPDNRWLLVPATGPNKVFINHFTAQVGLLEPNDPPYVDGPMGESDARQPRHLVFHPNLSVAYTTNERELPGVCVWQWDTENGLLKPIQNLVTIPEGFDGSITTADLHLTPNAQFLYVSNRDLTNRRSPTGNDSIAGFRVDAQTGALEPIGHYPCERIPRSFTIDKLGRFLYVAGQSDGKLGAYKIEDSGALTKINQYDIGRSPSWVETLSLPNDVRPFRPQKQVEFITESTLMEVLWDDGVFTEGPTVAPDGAVLFSDVRRQKIMRFDPKTRQVSIFRKESGGANGLVHDAKGRLLACEGADGGGRRISMTSVDGKVETLVDNWQGKRLNSPNDITAAPNGAIYFTDPRYRGSETREIDFEGVFLIEDGEARLATKDVERPNGIVISPDGRFAYVADNNNQNGGARKLYKFEILDDGSFGNRSELFAFGPNQRGIDGMTIDSNGNIYATAGKGDDAGVYVFGPDGEHLALIRVHDVPTNCTFGGPDDPNTLYITAQTSSGKFGLFRIQIGE